MILPFQIDMRNPLVHMTLWTLIATLGLLALLLLYVSTSADGRVFLYQSMPFFLLGLLFWVFIGLVVAFVWGLVTGSIIWLITFSALVSDRTITRYYLSVWIWIGLLLLIGNGIIAWLYVSNEQWLIFPLTLEPRLRDVWLSLLWMVVIPLIGATRFVDDLKADPRYLRKRETQTTSAPVES
ncbi:MAG: hypothetical protein AAF846_14050 [Chloroflexota bacterium]